MVSPQGKRGRPILKTEQQESSHIDERMGGLLLLKFQGRRFGADPS